MRSIVGSAVGVDSRRRAALRSQVRKLVRSGGGTRLHQSLLPTAGAARVT
ncbi:hypothetical protein [Streptomyces sp. 061-3]